LAGTWVSAPKDGCSEQIVFSEDGVIRVSSRDEVIEGTYKAEPTPESPTALKVTRTITASNRGPDCAFKTGDEVGKTRVAYAIWWTDSEMSLCFDPRGARCFGRFRK
jgi:hypothetical protein